MPRDTRLVTVHYRRLARKDGRLLPGTKLSDAVGQALLDDAYATDWQRRVTHAPGTPDVSQFVNNSHTDMDSTFGDLCSFTHDEMQAVISTGHIATPAVDIDDIGAPSGRDYLHGIAYWLLVGDHCYVIQHSSVRTKALEHYFTWLLRQAGMLHSDQAIILQAAFDVSTDAPDVGDVTGIEIGGIVTDAPEAQYPDSETISHETQVSRSLGQRVAPLDAGREWLRSIFGPIDADRIMAQVPFGAALKVSLHVGYVAMKRNLSRRAMDDLSVAVRNLDDGEVRIRGRKGQISRGEARLHMPARIKLQRANGNLLNFIDTKEKLENVHSTFLDEGRITPN